MNKYAIHPKSKCHRILEENNSEMFCWILGKVNSWSLVYFTLFFVKHDIIYLSLTSYILRHQVADLPIDCLTDWLTDWMSNRPTDRPTDWLTIRLTYQLTDYLMYVYKLLKIKKNLLLLLLLLLIVRLIV